MKKLITVSMLLIMAIVGLVVGYQSLEGEEIILENETRVPYLTDDVPVTATVMTISKPFKDEKIKIAVNFYDSKNQENSIIVIDKTYMPNRGILYQSEAKFDVLAIYDGTVVEIEKDDLLGNYVKIDHNNNLTSIYRILDDIQVKKGDYVKKSDKIATSGNSIIEKDNLLLFELQQKGSNVNPEDYYNKTMKEI